MMSADPHCCATFYAGILGIAAGAKGIVISKKLAINVPMISMFPPASSSTQGAGPENDAHEHGNAKKPDQAGDDEG
jgi:hypothetical protein